MAISCRSGKTIFSSEDHAIKALLDVWSRTPFRPDEGPKTIYRCEDCGLFHFTSKGDMHPELKELLDSGKLDRMREAARWEDKFRKF